MCVKFVVSTSRELCYNNINLQVIEQWVSLYVMHHLETHHSSKKCHKRKRAHRPETMREESSNAFCTKNDVDHEVYICRVIEICRIPLASLMLIRCTQTVNHYRSLTSSSVPQCINPSPFRNFSMAAFVNSAIWSSDMLTRSLGDGLIPHSWRVSYVFVLRAERQFEP